MNPIGPNDLGHIPLQMTHEMEGDPAKRMKRVLDNDMVRMDLHKKINQVANQYRKAFEADPLWVRVSYDLITRSGTPVFKDGDTVCGLLFRTLLEANNTIEVGASVQETEFQS